MGELTEKDIKDIKAKVFKSIKRVTIKIGSGVLTDVERGGLNTAVIKGISSDIIELIKQGYEFVIVSSGAVASGIKILDLKNIPNTIQLKQAAAAIGQGHLISVYERYFKRNGRHVAQILLTSNDLSNRNAYINIRNSILSLLQFGVVPIINENDTVAVDEIRFGDNDILSAMVSNLVEADILIILTDTEGLYTEDPFRSKFARLINIIPKVTKEIEKAAGNTTSVTGTGGMLSKIKAAKIASQAGIPIVISNGRKKNIIVDILKNKRDVGTLILPDSTRLKRKKHWIAFTSRVAGSIVVDDGAKKVLIENGKSLLPSGIVKVSGRFKRGDAISLRDSRGVEFARGLVNYPNNDVISIMGQHTNKIDTILGYKFSDEVIHRDNLVLLED